MGMKIAVLLSGGVDSSVALNLLQEQGYKDITAFYLKIWLEDEMSYLGSCPWEEDLEYAQAVCHQADVPLKIINLQREYYDRVVQYAVEELKEGRTPSPDIFCNQRIKFGAFFDKVQENYDYVATGHYAVIQRKGPEAVLRRSPDPVKDQTYFLSYLSQGQLQKILFPIGHLQKSEVRELAEKFDLPNKRRKDSQGICFLGKIKYRDFVGHYLGEKPGDIIERETGRVIGRHKGYWFHTIGQRQGLGLSNGPWYVVQKDIEANIIYISHKMHQENQDAREFEARRLTWTGSRAPDLEGDLRVKLRHGPNTIPVRIEILGEDRLRVILEEPDKGIAPGQFSVIYRGEDCLGAGMIHTVL
jgi:tRNA (5-methylaminomethyl-2-thiouridylate)-methyltransferase